MRFERKMAVRVNYRQEKWIQEWIQQRIETSPECLEQYRASGLCMMEFGLKVLLSYGLDYVAALDRDDGSMTLQSVAGSFERIYFGQRQAAAKEVDSKEVANLTGQ